MTTHHKPREEKKGLTAFWDYLRGKARPVLEVCDPALKVCTAPFSLHWEKKYKQRFPQHAHKLLVLDLVLLTIVAALITGGIFSEQVLPHGQSTSVVRLDLEAPETVISGSPVDLRFSYTNDAVAPVGCVQLRVHLPQDTVITGPLPSLESAGADLACAVDASLSDLAAEEARHEVLVFPQSDLGPAESDGVTVRTTLYGATDEPRTLWAELSYWEAGKTVPTRVSLRREWKIAGSVFAFDVVAPSVARGRSHPVTVRYANVGDAVLRGARVTIEPPADFTVTDGAVERSVGDLSSGEEGSLTISGYFRSLAADGVAPTFTVRGTALAAGERTLVGLHRENTDPRASDLAFSLEITQPAGRQTLLAGETVRATVHYRNEGDRPLRDLMVRVDPGAAFYDAASGPFLWDGKTDPALMEIAPGAEGTLTSTLIIPAKIAKEALGALPFPELFVSANASYLVADDEPRVRVDSAVTHLPISGHLELDGIAAYYTSAGDQIGTGPLPPKVGETTKYRIILSPSATTSAVRDLTIEAHLPDGVEWTGRTSVSLGGAIDFLPSTRTVRWRMDELPAWTGQGLPPAIATFEVAVTPTPADVGAPVTLTTGLSARGMDGTTGLALHATLPDLSTEIANDPRVSGKGNVVP